MSLHCKGAKFTEAFYARNNRCSKRHFVKKHMYDFKCPDTRCKFSCNLQRNSTLKRCKFVTNVWYVKNVLANCDGNMYLPILHLPRVELQCKLQEKLHRMTGPLVRMDLKP